MKTLLRLNLSLVTLLISACVTINVYFPAGAAEKAAEADARRVELLKRQADIEADMAAEDAGGVAKAGIDAADANLDAAQKRLDILRRSKDEEKAYELAQRIQSGTVWVNETQHLSPLAAFGGMKQSGVGVEGGLEGLLEYTNAQTLVRRKKAAFTQ